MTTPDDRKPRYRLYTEASLDLGVTVALSEAQAHYLGSVMRAKAGEAVARAADFPKEKERAPART